MQHHNYYKVQSQAQKITSLDVAFYITSRKKNIASLWVLFHPQFHKSCRKCKQLEIQHFTIVTLKKGSWKLFSCDNFSFTLFWSFRRWSRNSIWMELKEFVASLMNRTSCYLKIIILSCFCCCSTLEKIYLQSYGNPSIIMWRK